jgi:hypothetical protein
MRKILTFIPFVLGLILIVNITLYNIPTIKIPDASAAVNPVNQTNLTSSSLSRNSQDHPPTVSNITLPINLTKPVRVQFNAIDPDKNDTFTFYIVHLPAHGKLSSIQANNVTYTPDSAFLSDNFTYRAKDAAGLISTNNGTVTLVPPIVIKSAKTNLSNTVIVPPQQLETFSSILQWSTFATAVTLVIPLSLMLILTYLQGRAIGKGTNIRPFAVGQFYRLLVAVGVILTVVLIIVYLNTMIIIVPASGQQTLLETQKNFLTIVGTAFASLVAFYFGTRGPQGSNAERTTAITKPEAGQKALEVIDVNPIDGSMGVEVESPVTATFSAPIRSSSINPNTFSVKDANGNPVHGKITLTDNNTSIRFNSVLPLNRNNRYTVTATKGLMDKSGASIAADKEWHFTTVA